MSDTSEMLEEIHAPGGSQTMARLLAVFLLLIAQTATPQSLEYRLKAEFIERFTRFIEWPERTENGIHSNFILCIAGKNPFGSYFENMARQVLIQNRRLDIRYGVTAEQMDGCNAVFISEPALSEIEKILAITMNEPVLTIADTPGAAQRGVMMNLYTEENRLRFEINRKTVERSGLRFSPKLLKRATIVNDGKEE